MSEMFDNYGLRVKIIADYQYDDGRRVGQFKQVIADPDLNDVLESVLAMVEGCYSWGISRPELIDKVKASLDEIGKEYKTPAYRCDKSAQDAINDAADYD